MKHLLALYLIFCLLQTGCNQVQKYPNDNFPKSMVGVWEAKTKTSKWGIKFESDGSIKKIIHFIAGPVKIDEGGAYMEGPDEGTFAEFIVAPCEVSYTPHNNILKVKIVLEHYHMKFPTGDLIGNSEDCFEGPVPKENEPWHVEWRSFGFLEGAAKVDHNIIDKNPEKLTFIKLDFKDLPKN